MYRYNKDYYVSKSVYECRYFIDRGFKFYDVKPSYKDRVEQAKKQKADPRRNNSNNRRGGAKPRKRR